MVVVVMVVVLVASGGRWRRRGGCAAAADSHRCFRRQLRTAVAEHLLGQDAEQMEIGYYYY